MNTHLLFAIPVYEGSVEISEEDLEFCKTIECVRNSNENAFISTDGNLLSLDQFQNLKNQIGKNVMHFLCDVCELENDILVEIVSSWLNIHRKGDWGQTHKHINSVLSGVVYLKVPENSGDIVFESSYELFGHTLAFRTKSNNLLNRSEVYFTPKENTMLLFPSHLRHSILQNKSDDDRISLAFNCYIRTQVVSEGKLFNL